MDEYAAALVEVIEEVLPGWVERSVASVLVAAGLEVGDGVRADAAEAGRRAAAEVGAALRALLAADIDEQRSNPLSLLREAVRYPTEVLRRAGAMPVPVGERDDVKVRLFPDDVYDLSPATFADVDPRLTEPGLIWGAAKAHEHLRRHRRKQEEDP